MALNNTFQEAPPILPTLSSGKYQIKWTQLADLPLPFWRTYTAVQHNKIYITGQSPVEDAKYHVYVYDVNTDQWGQLPPSGHYYGVPHIIGGKLTIIGGRLSNTDKRTNKVSTFDDDSQSWKSYYPNLVKARSGPGVVSHLKYIIVAGGTRGAGRYRIPQDDIEVLNWVENSHWQIVPIILPEPMFGFTPIVSDNHLLIVGYHGVDSSRSKRAFKIPVASITKSSSHKHIAHANWIKMTEATHWFTTLIPNSSPPVVIGGQNATNTAIADINMYDYSNNIWKKVGSLSSARSYASVSAMYNNAIVVIGGYTKTRNKLSAKSSSVTLMELGQAELLHYSIIDC